MTRDRGRTLRADGRCSTLPIPRSQRIPLAVDRTQFDQLAIEHLDAVYRMAMHLTRNHADAADLVQETYLRAVKAAGRFEETGGGIKPWLLTILHNVFYSAGKRKSLGPISVGEIVGEDLGQGAPDEPPPAWDLRSLDWEHVDERLKKAIDDLSPEHREVLLLWGVEGMKYREIAGILGVPIGTVMSRLHRARKMVADSLEGFAEELGYNTRQGAGGRAPSGESLT